jgi:hypothetical protein
VIDAVPVGAAGTDIDHVVVGRAGVFTINTKAHANKRVWAAGHALRINGFRQDYIRNSQHEAARAARLLTAAVGRPITVTPLIVMVGISELNYGLHKPEVDVVTSRGIVRNLRRRRPVLTPDEVTEIADVASRRGTWHRDAVVLDDSQSQVERFEQLRGQVDAAAYRRKAWLVALKLAGLALVLWAAIDIVNVFVTSLASAGMR